MAKTTIFPAAIRYQGELARTCARLKDIGYEFDTDTLDKVTALVKALQDNTAKLEKLKKEIPHGLEGAKHARDEVLPDHARGDERRRTRSRRLSPMTCGRYRPIRRCCLFARNT